MIFVIVPTNKSKLLLVLLQTLTIVLIMSVFMAVDVWMVFRSTHVNAGIVILDSSAKVVKNSTVTNDFIEVMSEVMSWFHELIS